ncbi:hypothetical protein OA92_10000 [Marinomonas sp. SBI22]|uniref:phage tail fiber protein n=1 Tax=unclassified Marinomonas TaxID=196814 RepID=UPI0007AF9794|nr:MULTISPECIES: hypothetical protein [unclassified Marinomonas]KZM43083.1 hypothetical protein OA92_10000 [Marinomonas sp. SBI22]KZM44654.1 hypothetical protein OA91_09425 [Marinomonas sp. SBI8L]
MATLRTTAAINLKADGSIKDATQAQITASKIELGVYQVSGVVGLASEGWQSTIKENANGEKTISLVSEANESGVLVRTYERGTTNPVDIIDCLTLRFDLDVEVVEPTETAE